MTCRVWDGQPKYRTRLGRSKARRESCRTMKTLLLALCSRFDIWGQGALLVCTCIASDRCYQWLLQSSLLSALSRSGLALTKIPRSSSLPCSAQLSNIKASRLSVSPHSVARASFPSAQLGVLNCYHLPQHYAASLRRNNHNPNRRPDNIGPLDHLHTPSSLHLASSRITLKLQEWHQR